METQKINTAIIILNWNGIDLLKKFLPTLIAKSKNANIYIADNASTDNSIKFLEDNYTSIKILQNKTNCGFAGGYNLALSNLHEEFFILINSDIEVTDNWISPIIELLKKDEFISACQPKILDYNNKEKFEYAGASGGFIDFLGYPFCRGRIFNHIENDFNQYEDIKEVFWASGACLFIRSKHFNEVNGFDNDFFAHQEEIDLCWRLKNLGYKVMVNPESIVYHVGGGTLNSSSPFKTYLNFRNNLFMLFKNLHILSLFSVLFLRLFLDGIAALSLLTKKKGLMHLLAVLRAHFSFYLSLPSLIKKRSLIKQKNNLIGRFNFIILIKFYFKKIRKFSEL
ncbi:MAG: glycosyltransferase family 2 protein [Flavobacteriales bacterium]|jgi:GT2 family glycosyltransferase|tara:strand:- start:9681 stop:10697 length:1017 start_codon:yes stop_codon:yes gene_type:complete